MDVSLSEAQWTRVCCLCLLPLFKIGQQNSRWVTGRVGFKGIPSQLRHDHKYLAMITNDIGKISQCGMDDAGGNRPAALGQSPTPCSVTDSNINLVRL